MLLNSNQHYQIHSKPKLPSYPFSITLTNNKPFTNQPLFASISNNNNINNTKDTNINNNINNNNFLPPIKNQNFQPNFQQDDRTYLQHQHSNEKFLSEINEVIQKKKNYHKGITSTLIPSTNADINNYSYLKQNCFSNNINDILPHFKKNLQRNPFKNTQITSIGVKKFTRENYSTKDLCLKIHHEYNDSAHSVKEYSYNENKNYPFRKDMQDYHNIIDSFNDVETQGYFALLDGHGGNDVVEYANEKMPLILLSNLNQLGSNKELLFIRSFNELDGEIKLLSSANESGTTFTLIFICVENEKKMLYCSNLGDTKAILIRTFKNEEGKLDFKNFICLTKEHKCTDKEEAERIRNEGGLVFNGRLFGQLALSRALGDFNLKPNGLITKPSFFKKEVSEGDFIVACSDGVWDVVSEDNICDILFDEINGVGNIDTVGKKVIEQAKENGSNDNISCIVIRI